MKQLKLRTDIKFFIAMRMTEIIGTAADAISTTYNQLLWYDEDGDIIVDFDDRSVNVFNPEHNSDIIQALRMICDDYDFELNKFSCQCGKCNPARQQYN